MKRKIKKIIELYESDSGRIDKKELYLIANQLFIEQTKNSFKAFSKRPFKFKNITGDETSEMNFEISGCKKWTFSLKIKSKALNREQFYYVKATLSARNKKLSNDEYSPIIMPKDIIIKFQSDSTVLIEPLLFINHIRKHPFISFCQNLKTIDLNFEYINSISAIFKTLMWNIKNIFSNIFNRLSDRKVLRLIKKIVLPKLVNNDGVIIENTQPIGPKYKIIACSNNAAIGTNDIYSLLNNSEIEKIGKELYNISSSIRRKNPKWEYPLELTYTLYREAEYERLIKEQKDDKI